MNTPDKETARRMAADMSEAAIDALEKIKGSSTKTLIDCMAAAVSIAHVESLRAIVNSEDIDARMKSRLSMLMTIGNAYSVAIMELGKDPNTQWDDPVLFQGQLEHKIQQLFASAKQFDMKSGSIL